MHKLDKPLYHGTSKASAILALGIDGFNAPIYLTEDKREAQHYAKAATAYLEKIAREEGSTLIAEGCAVVTFNSVPDKDQLIVDDYNLEAEPGQWKYLKRIRGLQHFHIDYFSLETSEEEHLRLVCFAIGMWRN